MGDILYGLECGNMSGLPQRDQGPTPACQRRPCVLAWGREQKRENNSNEHYYNHPFGQRKSRARCLTNERQLGFAVHQYLTDWNGYVPHGAEYYDFEPDRYNIEFVGPYLGISSAYVIPGAGSVPGYVVAKDPL